MNEKIKQLAFDAGATLQFNRVESPNNQWSLLGNDKLEKFAELIIQECAKIADDGFGSAYFGLGINGAMLKQHFGLE